MTTTPYFTPVRTIDLEPRIVTETIHGTTWTSTVRAQLEISRLRDGRLYLHGKAWRNGQLVECYGVGGEVAASIFKSHTGMDIAEAALNA